MPLDFLRFWFNFHLTRAAFVLELPLLVVGTLRCRVGPGTGNYGSGRCDVGLFQKDEQWTRPRVILVLAWTAQLPLKSLP